MEHLFIINPEAGKGRSLGYIEEIKGYFKNSNEIYHIEVTKYPGHGTEIAREYSSKKDYKIYAVGGDGTLNEVLNGMIGSNSLLGVIPCGGGNDFVKAIVPKVTEDIFQKTLRGNERKVDVGKINNSYFLNISSVGFDSEVVYYRRQLKKIPLLSGPAAYILSVIRNLFTFDSVDAEIQVDDKVYKRKLLLAAIANGSCYGGGFKISPNSDIGDGILDLCLVDKPSKIKIFFFFPKAIKGTHGSIKEVSFYRGKKITIKSNQVFRLNIDGELFEEKEVNCEIIHKGVRLIIPE